MDIDNTITTLRDFRSATKEEKNELQIYVELEPGCLIEITEVTKVLAKSGAKPYLILRAR
ncbi:MAG: hypothetical protein KAR20_02690 [Candidatus Heimdallarchaeota archaeon]|nr:hypothetical protein [Candidatus Heimdallarchaeota archaeon]